MVKALDKTLKILDGPIDDYFLQKAREMANKNPGLKNSAYRLDKNKHVVFVTNRDDRTNKLTVVDPVGNTFFPTVEWMQENSKKVKL